MLARQCVQLFHHLQWTERYAVEGGRDALDEADEHLVWVAGDIRILGVLVQILDRGVPRIFEEARLDRASPHVLVDGIRILGALTDRQVVLLRVDDGLVAGEGEIAHRRNTGEFGCEGCHGSLEPDLVVALARASVGHTVCPEFASDGCEVTRDERTAQRRHQGVAFLIQRVGFQGGHQVVVGEFVFRIDDDRLHGTAIEGALTDVVHVLAALTDVDREGDDLFARGVFEPTDTYRGVEAAGISENNACRHGVELLVVGVQFREAHG